MWKGCLTTLQPIANGLIAGCAYALVALGFGLIYRTTRFFHFAHGVVYTAGAYGALAAVVWLHLPLPLAIPVGIGAALILGSAMEYTVYRPLRRRGTTGLVLLLASFGMYVALQNGISLAFGDGIQSLRTGQVLEGMNLLGARVTPVQLAIVSTSLILFVLIFVVLRWTRFGKALRAVASDPELALVRGIDADRTILGAFALGSGLAGLAAILTALDVDMTPTMGLNALMMGIVAMIVGGVGSLPGMLLGGLMLGLAQHLGVWKIGSQWQDAIAFAILVLFVLIRPQGIFGRLPQKARV